MMRIIIVALVALTIARPAHAEGEVLLHCNGDWLLHSSEGKEMERRVDVATIKMARNGAWMELGKERLKRTAKGGGEWLYSHDKRDANIQFTVEQMKFFIAAKLKDQTIYRYLYCFPITNPFLQYVE